MGAAAVCVRLSPRFYLVAPLGGDPFYVGYVGPWRFAPGLFLLTSPFLSAGSRVACVPACLLVRNLGAVDRERVVCFPFLLTPLAGAVAWLGARGEMGASDGTIAVAMSRVRWRSLVSRKLR